MRSLHEGDGLLNIDFVSVEEQLLDNSSIFIGFTTRQLIRKLNDGDISDSEVSCFYNGVRKFYMTTAEYVTGSAKTDHLVN